MRKQIIRFLILASLICLALTVTAFADEATVTGDDVNMRGGPGTNYEIVACLEKGATVTVNDCSNSYWYNVTYNGRTGFMSSYYLKINPAPVAEPVTETPAATNGYINAMYVRFRSGPGTGYTVLGEYKTGTKLTITGSSGDWTQVNINGKDGYVWSAYVSREEQAPAATPAPVQETPAVQQPAQPAYQVSPQAEKSGTITGNYVRFRTGPGTTYTIITSCNSGTPLIVKGTSGSWSQVVINGKEGFVFSQYVKIDPVQQPAQTTDPGSSGQTAETGSGGQTAGTGGTSSDTNGYIRGNCVRFRAGASTNTQILAEYNSGKPLKVIGHNGAWTRCVIDGKEGFVYGDYVALDKPSVSSEGSDMGKQIAAYALEHLGCAYRWGGTSPDTGFDCSGFVWYVYRHFGYTIQRVACNQANEGVHVDHADIQPGDILCFYQGDNYIGHSGIYIGNGQFIHASTETTGVIISDLATDNYEARRVA